MLFTREFFDLLIGVVIISGLALAARRLYRDLKRPLPGSTWNGSDTQPSPPHRDDNR